MRGYIAEGTRVLVEANLKREEGTASKWPPDISILVLEIGGQGEKFPPRKRNSNPWITDSVELEFRFDSSACFIIPLRACKKSFFSIDRSPNSWDFKNLFKNLNITEHRIAGS